MPGNSWSEILYNFIVIYLVLSFLLTCYSVIRMYVVKHLCNGVKVGKERINTLISQGRFWQRPLYSMEEIKKNKDLRGVRLSYFPNDTKETSRYILILPGGGYAHCCTREEGYPVAAKFNDMGYSVFVLEYRTGFQCSDYAPMEDVARAIQYIEEHKEEFHVETEQYAICGFSAGGNLAGMYASKAFGYEKYHTTKPAALMLGYPWTNVHHWLDHPYWNIWKGILGIWLSERGFIYMFGWRSNKEKRESLCVQNHVTEDYVPTYMFSGGRDVLVPASHHAEVLEKALDEHQVDYKYKRYFALPHGIGIAQGTSGEAWMKEAVAFWEKHCK